MSRSCAVVSQTADVTALCVDEPIEQGGFSVQAVGLERSFEYRAFIILTAAAALIGQLAR